MFQNKGVGSTILQRLHRQISLDYYTILPATQANQYQKFMNMIYESITTESFNSTSGTMTK